MQSPFADLFGARRAPRLALDFSAERIALFHKPPDGDWRRIDQVSVDAEDLNAEAARLRARAGEISGEGAPEADLWLPAGNVVNMDHAGDRIGAAKAIALKTGLSVEELAVDVIASKSGVAVSAVEKVVLEEARAHAITWGFAPARITTRHGHASFATGPTFAQAPGAEAERRRALAIFVGAGAVALAVVALLLWLILSPGAEPTGEPHVADADGIGIAAPDGVAAAETPSHADGATAVPPPELAEAAPPPASTELAVEGGPETGAAPPELVEAPVEPTETGPQTETPPDPQELAEETAPPPPDPLELAKDVTPPPPPDRPTPPTDSATPSVATAPDAERPAVEAPPPGAPPVALRDAPAISEHAPPATNAATVPPAPPEAPAETKLAFAAPAGDAVTAPKTAPAGRAPEVRAAAPSTPDGADDAPPERDRLPSPEELIAEAARAATEAAALAEAEAVEEEEVAARAPSHDPREQGPTEDAEQAPMIGPGAVAASPPPIARPDGLDMTPSDLAVAAAPSPKPRPKSIRPRPQPTVATGGGATQDVAAPRRGPPTGPGVANAATLRGAIDLGAMNLIGVYGSDGGRRALLRLPSGEIMRVKKGSVVDGWVVSSIDRGSMRITRGGEAQVLKVAR